ncbi:cell cycle checkpoint [Clavulina sp. PMI_390]|nr:cell cycle checkpoint [Clavulina sp. PMI_390]
MRFRTDVDQVVTFYRIAQSIQALTKTCILRWGPEFMQIIVAGGENDGGVQVWSKIKVENLFSEYRIQSNNANEINMEISTALLVHALKISNHTNVTKVTIKLAKRGDIPKLSFEVDTMNAQRKGVKSVHDVQIKVLPSVEANRLVEPQCPTPNIYIFLPRLTQVRTVTERFRPLSTHLGVEANPNGSFRLSIRTEDVSLETCWNGCVVVDSEGKRRNPGEQGSQDENEAEDESDEKPNSEGYFHAIVAVRSFLHFLSSHVVSASCIAAICQNHCLIMYVYIFEEDDAGGVLTFFIPASMA